MDELLSLRDATLRRGEGEVFSELSLTLRRGERVGLVGRNGIGKTTLLELLAGRLRPSEGKVTRAPGLRVGYSAQNAVQNPMTWRGTVWEVAQSGLEYVRGLERDLRESETALGQSREPDAALARYGELTALFEAAGGYGAESTLRAYLERLGFSREDSDRDVRTLSGGERARLSLARTLAGHPDLLLLDEPSTYLDLPGTRWLADTLGTFPGTLLLASHDRALLDAVTTHTLHLTGGKLTSYRGNYSRFQLQADHSAARALREARRLAHERRSLEARARQQPTLAARRSLERRLERLTEMPESVPADRDASNKNPTLTLDAPSAVPPGSLVLEAQNLSLTLAGRDLLRNVSLSLYAGDKVALVGPNGSGKTSLLRLLAGELEPDEGEPEPSVRFGRGARVAVFDQHGRGLEDGVTLAESLGRSVSAGRARSLLGLVGLGDAFERTPETLSGGQRARVGLAQLMATGANLLLLDEPSEGLDIDSIETLEAALQDTSATLLFVTHDAALVEAVATRVLGLTEGELREYRGGLTGYYAGTLRLEPDLPEPTTEALPDETDPAAELEALEDESRVIDDLLTDPLRLSERDRARLERRYIELTNLRAERYDAPLTPPLPRYRVREGGLTLTTNADTTPIILTSETGVTLHLYIESASRIGHLTLQDSGTEATCLLPWAEDALIRGALRLAFEHLEVRAVQLQKERDVSGAGLASAGEGWWVLDREHYADLEGLVRRATPPPRRRRRRRKKVSP